MLLSQPVRGAAVMRTGALLGKLAEMWQGAVAWSAHASWWQVWSRRSLFLLIVIGAVLHLRVDLGPSWQVVPERLLRRAPLMAPLLFSNMGLVGLVALMPSPGG